MGRVRLLEKDQELFDVLLYNEQKTNFDAVHRTCSMMTAKAGEAANFVDIIPRRCPGCGQVFTHDGGCENVTCAPGADFSNIPDVFATPYEIKIDLEKKTATATLKKLVLGTSRKPTLAKKTASFAIFCGATWRWDDGIPLGFEEVKELFGGTTETEVIERMKRSLALKKAVRDEAAAAGREMATHADPLADPVAAAQQGKLYAA